MRAVVNPHGTELPQEVLAQQSVKVHVKHLLQLIEVHDGDLLRSPSIVRQLDVRRAPQRISVKAGASMARRHSLKIKPSIAIDFCADNGPIGAGVEQKCGGITIHFTFKNNQGLHSAEVNSDYAGMRGIGQRHQQEHQEGQRASKRPAALRAHWTAPPFLAQCVQNGAAALSGRQVSAMEKCVQIKLSEPGLQANGLRTSNSLDDQLYGSTTTQSIRLPRLNLTRCHDEPFTRRFQTAPADACV